MPARVWIVGEGNNELGADDGYGKRRRGVLEALLARMCDGGWECSGKLQWNAIQKFRAGGARLADPGHGDYLTVLGLVLTAHENAADAVAFARDVERQRAAQRRGLGFERGSFHRWSFEGRPG
jgi:hypothetical protein